MIIKKYKSSQFSQRFIRVILDVIIGWGFIWIFSSYLLAFKLQVFTVLSFDNFLTFLINLTRQYHPLKGQVVIFYDTRK